MGAQARAGCLMKLVGVSRPYPGETRNGDAWRCDTVDGTWRIALVDALGHGDLAADAADAALAALAVQPGLGAEDSLRLCHRALAGTRGAAMLVVEADPRSGWLRYGGVGNVEGRLWRDGSVERLMSYRGIVGGVRPHIRAFELPLAGVSEWWLVLHTDGIRARFEMQDLVDAARQDPHAAANALLADWARPTDDATVVLVGGGVSAG